MRRRRGRSIVQSFIRLIPFVWPHRRKAYLSFAFAGLVAVFWSLNLSVAFPVIKVLLERQSLTAYVDEEISAAEQEATKKSANIEQIDRKLEQIEQANSDDLEVKRVDLLKDRARQQEKLSSTSRRSAVMNWIKTYVLPWTPRDQFDLLAVILLTLLVVTVLKGVCVFAQEVLIGSVVELTAVGVRKEAFRRALALDYQTLSKDGTPNLMSRFTYDMGLMSQGLTLIGGKIVREPLKAICCVIGAFLISWQLTLLSMLFLPMIGVVFYNIGRKLKRASHRLMESMSRIYKTLEESFDGVKIVIAFNSARQHRQRFHRDNREFLKKSLKMIKIDALTSPTTEVLGLLGAFIALLPGAYLVLRGTTSIWGVTLISSPMDVAELSMMYVMLVGVLDPMRKLSTTYAKLKRAGAAADRIFGLIDEESLVKEPERPTPLPRHARSIEFRDVHFAYSNGQPQSEHRPPVLNGVNLTVKSGEVIVVVGENGSGKSTLVNLLPRYYDPDSGGVLIDGVDVRLARFRQLRGQIGVVTQETVLFDGTIYDNIRYGRPGSTREEIERAARNANVTQFLDDTFPDGFDTQVGEKGRRLSGGQRQRIALARAVLRDPAILILDEATSAVDAHSEVLIHQALREFAPGRTVFIITHSVSRSILDFVSRIVVMDQGRMVAVGPHEKLIKTSEIYQRLYQAQVDQRAEELHSTDHEGFDEVDGRQEAAEDFENSDESLQILPLTRQHRDKSRDPNDAAG